MAAGRRYLERPSGALLRAHVREVGHDRKRLEVVIGKRHVGRIALAAQVCDRLAEVPDADRRDTGKRHLGRRLGRAYEVGEPCSSCALSGDQRARDRPEPPVEPELAERRVPVERGDRHLVRRGEHGERDRQVET